MKAMAFLAAVMFDMNEGYHVASARGRTCRFAGVKAGCCAMSHASTRCTSALDSFTLYTSTYWIAKSDSSPGADGEHLFMANLSNAAHVLIPPLSLPFDLNELLRSDPSTQLSLLSDVVGVIHPHELSEP